MNQDHEHELEQLFSAYREACPDPSGSSEFLPQMWAKIESSAAVGNWLLPLRVWAGRVAAAATLAAALLIGLVGLPETGEDIDVLEASYLDALAADSQAENEDLWMLVRNGQ